MADYNVTITNGSGSESMKRGNYTVSVNALGYDDTTLEPAAYTVTDEARTGTFTVSATGTLTFNVNETGAAGGTPITAGSIVMTDQNGTETYGNPVNIGATGDAVFNNVPFGSAAQPVTLYFRQVASDESHNIRDGIITVNMTADTQTEYVQNTPYALQTFSLTDANYAGLPVASASLEFTEQT